MMQPKKCYSKYCIHATMHVLMETHTQIQNPASDKMLDVLANSFKSLR